MPSAIKKTVKQLTRKIGFTSNQRIVVFESDDWGSIRVPSAEALETFKSRYPDFKLDHYQSLDGLDAYRDAKRLEDCLRHYTDAIGNHPVFTMNFATVNPVFSNDAENRSIWFEPITETYARYYPGEKTTIDAIRESSEGPFCLHPQLHAREHMNATRWFQGAQESEALSFAYDLQMIGLDSGTYHAMDALSETNSMIDKRQYLIEAAHRFQDYFGFSSESFIAPCYVISGSEERALAELGIKTLQSGWSRNRDRGNGKYRRVPNIMGQRNRFGQVRLVRNCEFEPSKWFFAEKSLDDCVSETLNQIESAFSVGQPAIICTHRVNYASLICEDNSRASLRALDCLITKMNDIWSSIVFISSDELGAVIRAR